MSLADMANGFSVLMKTPGFPQILGLFSVVCVFLGAILFTSNGHKYLTIAVIALVLVVAEEILRASYFASVFGILRPNPIALAGTVYVTMLGSVLIGYLAKKWAFERASLNERDVTEDVTNLLKVMNIKKSRSEIRSVVDSVAKSTETIASETNTTTTKHLESTDTTTTTLEQEEE